MATIEPFLKDDAIRFVNRFVKHVLDRADQAGGSLVRSKPRAEPAASQAELGASQTTDTGGEFLAGAFVDAELERLGLSAQPDERANLAFQIGLLFARFVVAKSERTGPS